jgi:putative ABC transport system substrate-binding protein
MVSDPVGQGFVTDLAHPGGNIPGFTNFEPSLGPKWLQLLKEVAPMTTRVCVMFNPQTSPYNALILRSIEATAQAFSVTVSPAFVQKGNEFESSFAMLANQPGVGLLVPSDTFTYEHSEHLVALAAEHHIPAIYAFRRFALDGGLASYSIDVGEQFRQAAIYVDQILRGTKPGELPIQMPTKFEVLINLKAAKALGLTVPPSVLARADEVIE